jgi:GDP-L-fucose synthase
MNLKNKRVLVTGGNGFLGHHIVSELKRTEPAEIIISRSKEYDLTQEKDVERLFESAKPDVVFHLAGLVGGILANKERPAEYFYQNLLMGTFMLHYSSKNKVEKFIAAGAGCGYPEHAEMPLKETAFWEGFPQKESAPYSLAKRLLTIQSMAYFEQYGFPSIICVPGNLYGPWDNFNLHEAHVIPSLVRKFVEATESGSSEVEVWGTGRASRDFVFASDVARGMVKAAGLYSKNEVVNISSGVETTVLEVCDLLKELTGFNGDIRWNTDRPDGQLRRCFDMSKAKSDLSFVPKVDIRAGLQATVDWYRDNMNSPELRK